MWTDNPEVAAAVAFEKASDGIFWMDWGHFAVHDWRTNQGPWHRSLRPDGLL